MDRSPIKRLGRSKVFKIWTWRWSSAGLGPGRERPHCRSAAAGLRPRPHRRWPPTRVPNRTRTTAKADGGELRLRADGPGRSVGPVHRDVSSSNVRLSRRASLFLGTAAAVTDRRGPRCVFYGLRSWSTDGCVGEPFYPYCGTVFSAFPVRYATVKILKRKTDKCNRDVLSSEVWVQCFEWVQDFETLIKKNLYPIHAKGDNKA